MPRLLLARTESVNGLSLIDPSPRSADPSHSHNHSHHHIGSGAGNLARRKSAGVMKPAQKEHLRKIVDAPAVQQLNGDVGPSSPATAAGNGHAVRNGHVAGNGHTVAAADEIKPKTTSKRAKRGEVMVRFPFISSYIIPALVIFLYTPCPNFVVAISVLMSSIEMFMCIERVHIMMHPPQHPAGGAELDSSGGEMTPAPAAVQADEVEES